LLHVNLSLILEVRCGALNPYWTGVHVSDTTESEQMWLLFWTLPTVLGSSTWCFSDWIYVHYCVWSCHSVRPLEKNKLFMKIQICIFVMCGVQLHTVWSSPITKFSLSFTWNICYWPSVTVGYL
jgi:hypothetical protein